MFVIEFGKGIIFYETNRRKIQENCEILANQLQAGKRTRSFVPGSICSIDAGLYVVGYPNILNLSVQSS